MIFTYYGAYYDEICQFRPAPPESPPQPSGGRVPLSAPGRTYPQKSSDGRTVYDVHRLPDGRWTCPCKGFGYRDDCRHVQAAQLEEAREHGAG